MAVDFARSGRLDHALFSLGYSRELSGKCPGWYHEATRTWAKPMAKDVVIPKEMERTYARQWS